MSGAKRKLGVAAILLIGAAGMVLSFFLGAAVQAVYFKGLTTSGYLPAPYTPRNEMTVVRWEDPKTLRVDYSDGEGMTWHETVHITENHYLSLPELNERYPSGTKVLLDFETESKVVAKRNEERELLAPLPKVVPGE